MEKIIAFDMDGTVAETFPVIFDSFRRTVHDYTGKWISNQVILATFGANEIGMLKELVPDYSDEVLKTFHENYRRAHLQLRHPFEGIEKLIKELHERKVITPMITGKGEQSLQVSLDSLGLSDSFSPVLSGSPDGSIKAKQFGDVIKQYGATKEDMAYIGDAPSDVTACNEAGIKCYSAAWSINAKTKELEKLNPDDTYTSVDQLREKLINE
ncbi:HAD family hydrolase [Lentilactobacillus sunkii]|jgi:phosphoglycolate phosphatase|uniref:Haloacid dehalogenase domain-containing protein hydrolase n=2 Tax=Lentilactobacillus sunkii TaxID=481719 RepID=A0A0R1KXU0_9LACO|nr:HAD hydrolase-like protein [Lentilactobacillus sunkii]KRK88300.1 haloacid dehalogenase domain-containing protein hydrolase [Lentilactobacillus sunkii DSM 19904]OFA12615.1 pyrophosphatase PpaX [Lentilactobacillus sunkii]